MIFPQPMVRLSAVVLQRDTDVLTRSLLNLGVMDFIDVRGKDFPLGGRLKQVKQQIGGGEIVEMRERIEQFLVSADLELPSSETLDADRLFPVDSEEVEKELDGLASDIRMVREKQKEIQQEKNRKGEIRRQAGLFDEFSGPAPADSAVEVLTGILRKSRKEGFEKAMALFPSVIHWGGAEETEFSVMLLYLRRDADRVNPILDRFGWQSIDFPPELQGRREDILARLDEEIESLEKHQHEWLEESRKKIVSRSDWLCETWKNLQMNSLYIRMQDRFGATSDTVLFAGWIPSEKQNEVQQTIKRLTAGRCYLEWKSPDADSGIAAESVPVRLKHSKVMGPFQWVVKNYALPRYGTIDPTLIVAVSFLAMFGLMFGDAGHGLVLALTGGLIARMNRKKQGTAFDLGRLILWCGGASIFTGILFGSYFGYSWFPPLWFDYHGIVSGHGGNGLINDVYDILGITIRFGVLVIGAGIVLNIIQRARAGQWFSLVFDKGGLLGGWFYAGGVYSAFVFAGSGYKAFPSIMVLTMGVLFPAVIFALKAPLEFLEKRKAGEARFRIPLIMDWVMDWIVELLELFSGYLSNTLSFMRIAGLGIAHVSLMTAFFQMAGMTDHPVAKLVILVLGNALVIVLEGLSAGIQSMRLNYYEFFSKYFCGSGKVYEPISLRRSS